MADDDDQEEFLDVEDPDSPGSPVNTESVQVVKGSKTGSKSEDDRSPDRSVSEMPILSEEARSKTSGIIKTNGSGSKRSRDSVEESSKSHEVIRRSQELSLSGKQSSLDRLSEKQETGQRTKISKWQRQCNRQFRDMIGKREMKNEELERQQDDLRQRLNILECSMPAVMVWNIWRMTQGDKAPCLQQVVEKQFQGPASGEVYCPTSPSRHFDCRVREAEAERKQALNRVEEARTLWAEKMASLEDREKRLQEARKLQEEQQKRIEQLTTEVQKLREARSTEDEGACEAGECGVIACRKKWLEKVPSSASIRSTDIECLEKLHELAEAELCMKRQIGDLERREQAYMRTLQQADELWNCLEREAAGTIQEQLETKTQRITELEEELEYLRSKMATCREELEKHMSIGKIEALIGRDDDFASVKDTEALAAVSIRDEISGRGDGDDDVERMTSKLSACREALGQYISAEELEAIIGADDGKEISTKLSACKDALGKYISAEQLEAIVGGDDEKAMSSKLSACTEALGQYVSAEELEAIIGADDGKEVSSKLSACKDALGKYISAEELEAIVGKDGKFGRVDVEESTVMDAQKLLAQIGSLSELDGPGSFCAPDFDCNDLRLSETGLPEEERIALEEDRVTARELLDKYGLLEIVEQMGAKTAGGVQFKMVEKYEVEMTEDVGVKETKSEIEEVVEREVAYDEEASEHDGVKEDEDGVQEDEIGVMENEAAIVEDEVGIVEDEIGVDEDEIGVQEDEIGAIEDEIGEMEDKIGVMEDEVRLVRDEFEEKHSVPSMKAESVSVPMDQLSSWQDRVHAVRLKISECPSCDTMDREAKIVADELSAYTGRTMELDARERIAKDKESLEIKEEMMEFAEEEDGMKIDRREDDKVDVKVEEKVKRESVDEVKSVEEERKLKELEEVEEKDAISAAVVKSERPTELDEEKPAVKEEVVEEVEETEEEEALTKTPLEKKDAEEVPELGMVKEEVEGKEIEGKEPEPTVKEALEEMPEKKPEIEVKEEEIEPEKAMSEEDEVEEVPVERLEEFEVAVEVDVISVEDESEPEEKEIVRTEIEVDEVLIKEEPTEEEEVPEEIAPLKEESEFEEEGIIAEEIEVEEIPIEVVGELKPEVIVPKVDVIPKEEPLRPEEETIVDIPVEEAEEEIKAEVPELERIELEVDVLEDTKVPEVDVEIEIIAPVEVLKEKDEEAPEEPEVFEISVVEECTCHEFYDVEYLLPPVIEEDHPVEEEESVCQCMAEEDHPPEVAEEPDDCQCSTEGPSDKKEEPAECECMKEDLQDQAEVTLVEKEDSGVCKCTSKTPSEEKPPSVKTKDSSVCRCKSKTPSEAKPPSVKKKDSGVCKCKSKTPSEEKPPSVKKKDSGVCKCTSKVPSEEKTPSVRKGDSDVCKCIVQPPVKKEESAVCQCTTQSPTQVVCRKMEITQTSITQFEAQKTTIQAVTQTVADVGMQAQPPPKLLRQHPKVTDAENVERLTCKKRSQDRSGATMVTITSQTEKSSFLRILQTLKTSGVYTKVEPEKELRTIHYGKKSDDAEGRCNCCLCGKTAQDAPSGSKTAASTHPETPASSVVKLLQALPLMCKTGPGVDQGVQHESSCKECNVKRFQKSIKPQGPSTMEPKQIQTSNDQAVCVSKSSLKGLTYSKSKKADQTTLSMIKVQKSGRRKPPSEKTSALNSQPEHKLKELKEDENPMECICSSMGTRLKKIRCACGDPD